jgi:signal transduction histidine kinase
MLFFSFALADRYVILRNDYQKTQQELLESQQNAIENLKQSDLLKDRLMGSVSHELKIPLHGIVGLTRTILESASNSINERSDEIERLRLILQQGERLSLLVNDILDYNLLRDKRLKIHRTSTYLSGILNGILPIIKTQMDSSRISLSVDMPDNLPPVYVDSGRVEQIFYNLLSNAIRVVDRGQIHISARFDDQNVLVEIRDTGRGMSAHELEQLLDESKRSDGFIQGMGLGFSITRQLITLNGGDIHVNSTPGEGTTIQFSLPVTVSMKENQKEMESASPVHLDRRSGQYSVYPKVDHYGGQAKFSWLTTISQCFA